MTVQYQKAPRSRITNVVGAERRRLMAGSIGRLLPEVGPDNARFE